MKFSFTTLTTPDNTIEQMAQMAKRYGYDGVDLRVSNQRGQLTLQSSVAEMKRTQDCFNSEGILIPSLLCYPETYTTPSTDTRALEDWFKRHIEIGEGVGAQAIRLFTLKTPSDTDRYAYLDAYAQALHRVLLAEKPALQVLIQNHQMYATAEEALYVVKKTAHPNVHMVYSHDHCIMTGERTEHFMDDIIRHSGQLYIADVLLQHGKYVTVLPGQGSLPLEEIYNAFLQHGFQGFTTFKWYKLRMPELAEPEVSLPYFINRMKQIKTHS